MKSIICRQDSTRNQVVFLLDSLNNETHTLDIWRGNDKKLEQVTVDFYRTTRQLSDQDETAIANRFVDTFGIKDGIILRRRLYKSAPDVVHNNAAKDGHAAEPEPLDKEVFLNNLIANLEKMIRLAAANV
jgi:hypothetical protein